MNCYGIYEKANTDIADQTVLSAMSVFQLLNDIKELQNRFFTKYELPEDKKLVVKMQDELFYREKKYRKIKFQNIKVNSDNSVNFNYTGDPQPAQVYYPAGVLYAGYIWTTSWQRHG